MCRVEKHLSHGESLSCCCHFIFVRQLFSVFKKAVLHRRKLSNNLSTWIVYCCGSAKQLKQTTKTNYLRVISISCCLKSKNLLFSKLHVKRWLKTLYFSGTVWFWKTTFQVSAIFLLRKSSPIEKWLKTYTFWHLLVSGKRR